MDAGSEEINNRLGQYELEIDFNSAETDTFGLELFASETEGLVLEFDRTAQSVRLNREKFAAAFGGEFGFVRSSSIEIGETVKVQVFVDRSIAEIFVNDGEVVFTARVFPKEESNGIKIFSDGKINFSYKKHELAKGISI